MTTLASVLKKEILRLAKKEARTVAKDLQAALGEERKQVKALRGEISSQAKEIASLRKAIEKGMAAAPKAAASAVATSVAKTKTRAKKSVGGWRKDSVRTTRRHHELSQGAFAKLIGVGLNTVWLWENGRTTPRPKQQEAVLELRALGTEELAGRLSGIGLAAGRQKPGRKKGAPAKAKNSRKKSSAAKAAKKPAAKKTAKKTARRKKTAK